LILLGVALLGGLLGPLLAQLSRVLATRDPLFARDTWRSLDPRYPGFPRAGICTAVNAAAFALAAWRWPASPAMVVFAMLFSTLIVVSVIDVEQYRIPDRITFPTMTVGATLAVAVAGVNGDRQRLVALVVATALFWGALGVGHLISPAGLGRGDVKLGVTLGMALGWVAPAPADAVMLVVLGFFAASTLGTLQGVALLIIRRRSSPYPFGPALAAGATAVVLLSRGLVGS
jgi:leader peptidase (prepilin peptidase)/N-methyltransferase